MKSVTALTLLSIFIVASASAQKLDEVIPKVRKPRTAPLETSPEKRAADCKAIGKELGDLGQQVRGKQRLLCEAMRDPDKTVRFAALDAMKLVDPDAHKICVVVVIDGNISGVRAIGQMGARAKPFAPVVMHAVEARWTLASIADAHRNMYTFGFQDDYIECVRCLIAIAPDDAELSAEIIDLLSNPSPKLRAFALGQLSVLRDKSLAVPVILKYSADASYIGDAIRALPGITDDKTRDSAKVFIGTMRYHKNPAVRVTVEQALKKLD